MSSYICIDSSVLIKLLVNEEGSEEASALMEKVIGQRMAVVLPDFAWAEVGTVLRKKAARKLITREQAEIAWEAFYSFGVLTFINDVAVMRAAWRIAEKEKLSTLYDAAYLAVAEIISRQDEEECQFWTADERLANSVNKKYIRLLKDFK
ncbi:nucleic acid-binding protein [Desulfocucumis palustris]|uniref:Nucleic acid-binding protein n=1 Tax=Desulfocucumis palustris TaxID=1898651 RepID=A0A2L2XDQ0_9FIRM|nr:type II toxin-antitoxin system VapC family toxin [Desulfocucumis palustris]GBF31951.1 nucleic acid-binding protein [Desulfocucumis palustris]